MARHYGDAREAPEPEFGAADITLVNGGAIFAGTPETQTRGNPTTTKCTWSPTASTSRPPPSCEVQGMENEDGTRFGLQFHPEVNDSEFGREMFENFIRVCREARDGAPSGLQVRLTASMATRMPCSTIDAFDHASVKSAPTA